MTAPIIPSAVGGWPDAPDRALVSDSLRVLAPSLHEAFDQLLAQFQPDGRKGELRGRRRDAEMALLDAQLLPAIQVLQLAGAQAAVRVLAGLRSLLHRCAAQSGEDALQLSAAQADAAVDALWRLHDYLDGLHDKSGDTDIFDGLLFAPWRRLALAVEATETGQAPVPAATSGAPGLPRAPNIHGLSDFEVARAQLQWQLQGVGSFEAMLAALQAMADALAMAAGNVVADGAVWQAHAHAFLGRLVAGRQALDAHVLALLDEIARQLVPGLGQAGAEAGSGPGPAPLIARIGLLSLLADEQLQHWRRPANESQLMVRLMLQADETQEAWDRCVGLAPGPQRLVLAWQWQDNLLRAAATARRLWPRLRAPGLSGFLHALARLGPELAMMRDAERRDREVSSCLILLEEALRRRFYLQEDSLRQGDRIVQHLACLVRGVEDSEGNDFPWFSRELRGELARRMEGVVEGEILRKLRDIELSLEALWQPDPTGSADAEDAQALAQGLVTHIHDELSQVEALSASLQPASLARQGPALRQLVGAYLGRWSQTAAVADAPVDTARAGMVRDLARFGQMLEQSRRSPPNRWRREAVGSAIHQAGISQLRQLLDRDEPGPSPDEASAAHVASAAAPAAGHDFLADPLGLLQPEQHDPEMMEVFLAEAWQLLEELRAQLPLLGAGGASLEQLQAVRRCFHTFKGSGRMVGLHAMSDAAQAMEMVLNTCLSQARASGQVSLEATVLQLLDSATLLLATWFDELAAAGRCARRAPALIAAALRLRNSLAGAVVRPPADTAAASATVPEVHDAGSTAPAPVSTPVSAPLSVPLSAPVAAPLAVAADAASDQATDPQLRDIYLAEARQLFKTLRQHGSSWRAKADSGLVAGPPPVLARAMHTLRGCSAAAGFTGMQGMAAALEELFDHLKTASVGLDSAGLHVVEAAVSTMHAMQERYAAGGLPAADSPALAQLARLLAGLRGQQASPVVAAPVTAPAILPEAASAPLSDEIDAELLPLFLEEGHDLLAAVGQGLHRFQQAAGDTALLAELLRPLHTVKGSARMTGALRLGQCMHELESAIQRLLRHAGKAGAEVADGLLALYDRALRQFEALEQLGVLPSAEGHMQPLSESERKLASPLVRIKVSVLDHLLSQVGEVSIARSQLENEVEALRRSASELADNVAKLGAQLRDVEIQAEIRMSASSLASHDGARFDPLELDRFTHLHELTRMMAENVNDVASLQKQLVDSAASTQNGLLRQGRIMRELQQQLMDTRMVKFKSLEPRLQHLVWQLDKETGKTLALEIAGGEVELDRGILEKMIGPFEHLLRNAAVHGIESREERVAAGKGLSGCLRVQVMQEGSEAVIRISDDGAGLDLEAIRAKAQALGLLAEGQPMSDARLTELIFEPGFSTTAQVSALAGRGVGMDVVRSEVTALGGRITLHSLRGAGASFTMHLPLSLAVKQVCLLRLGAQSYAIPSMLVDKVVQLRGEQMRQAVAEGTVGQGSQQVALHALSSLLDEPPAAGGLPPASVYVLYVKSGNELVAIMVDQVSGNREVVAKPVGPQLGSLVGVVGATVLGNGEIALIINPLLLARRIGYLRLQNARHEVPGTARKIVMVVDDSLTVRKVTQRLLVREGYAVVTATDGYDAIRQLHEVTPDVFLVDIEMPRMDGFTLVRHLRDNESTSDRPIVMITSRTGAKHRERAMEVGVNYYLGKPYQEQQLLALIRHYTRHRPGRDDFSDVLY